MLSLSDARWSQVEGGYRVLYDPRLALAQLERDQDVDGAWSELWEGLYHQGHVGTASYAAVPHLLRVHRIRDVADWNTYALVGAIEQGRSTENNPPIPSWLKEAYDQAWREVPALALRDLSRSEHQTLAKAALGVVAMARGLRRAGEILLDFTDDELAEMIHEYRGETS
jgi:hypothetical protein